MTEDTTTSDRGTSTEEDGTDPPPASGTTERPGTRRMGAGPGAVAPWIVAVVAVGVAIVALVQWWQLDGTVSADEEVRETAGQVVAALTNWQADDLTPVRETLERHGTDRFVEEASQLLDQFSQGLEQAEARSTGEILNLVADADAGADSAVALAVVRQEVTNTSLEGPDVQCWGTRVILQPRGEGWLVDGVELYGPNQCPDADDAATGGSTDTPTTEGSP